MASSGPATSTATVMSKAAFLQACPGYGYGPAREPRPRPLDAPPTDDGPEKGGPILEIDRLREAEFPALYHPTRNPQGVVYLDHAGATLHGRSQLAHCHARLQEGLFGNPHSKGPVASATAEQVEEARALVLEHFNGSPEEWSVVFTAGATAAHKLVAEVFPWGERGRLVYAHNSHTSVLGMREMVRPEASGGFACLPPGVQYGTDEALAAAVAAAVQRQRGEGSAAGKEGGGGGGADDDVIDHHLLVLPGECNFSGRKQDWGTLGGALSLLEEDGAADRGGRVSVLLDAAKLVATAPLDLSALPARVEAVALSFYKMFGYPTGLGCCLLRHTAPWLQQLASRRRYFGGGTVLAALPARDFVRLRPEPAHRLADGTQDYLGILAVGEGLRTLWALAPAEAGKRTSTATTGAEAMAAVAAHTAAVAAFFHNGLRGLMHGNGAPVVELYSPRPCPQQLQQQGPVVAFNLRRAGGESVGYAEVERLCGLHSVQLRTGCFCNPGACQVALGLSEQEVLRQLAAGHVCWDENDLVEGRPTGAVRASFGYMSTWEDAAALLALLDKYFVSRAPPPPVHSPLPCPAAPETPPLTLGAILLYPIKSCGAMRAEAWPLGPTGLLFDREWALVDAQGQALRLNRLPRMRFIEPRVDLEAGLLRVTAPGMARELQVPLTLAPPENALVRGVSVCGEACQGVGGQAEADAWFSAFLGRPCALVRAAPHASQRRAAHQRQQRREAQEEDGEEEGEGETRSKEERKKKEIGFSNEAQFLLVSRASVEHLNGLVARQRQQEQEQQGEEGEGHGGGDGGGYEFRYEGRPVDHHDTPSLVTVDNFRPNLVVDGGVAHQEDLWASVELLHPPSSSSFASSSAEVGERVRLQVTGPCARCSMVNIDHQQRGKGKAEEGGAGGGAAAAGDAIVAPVLKTLASYRRDKANIYFGQFLVFADEEGGGRDGGGGGMGGVAAWLRTGMHVRARRRSDEAGEYGAVVN